MAARQKGDTEVLRHRVASHALGLLVGGVVGLASLGTLCPATARAQGLDVVGHLGGAPAALTTQAGRLCLALGPEVALFDVSLGKPGSRRGYVVFRDMVQDVALTSDGAYAAVAARAEGLRLVDITQPAVPREVASLAAPGGAMGVAIEGRYAYVATGSGLQIVDIADPAHIRPISALEASGSARRVALHGDHVYVARLSCGDTCQAGLLAVDVSDPERPVAMGTVEVEGWAAQVDVAVASSGSYVFLAAGMAGMRVIDVSDPGAPVEVGAWKPDQPLPNVWRVHVIGDRDWLADGTAGLYELDVSHPAVPTLVASCPASGGAVDVTADNGNVYLVTPDTLVTFDVGDPAAPRSVASQSIVGNAERLALDGGTVYVGGGRTVWAVNIAKPAEPGIVGTHPFEREVQAVTMVSRSDGGDALLVADGDCAGGPCRGTLRVIDLADATHPNVVGTWQPPDGYPIALATAREFGYLAARDAGLWVLDLSSLESPRHVSSLPVPGFVMDVVVPGPVAYLAARSGGLYVVDIMLREPTLVGVLPPRDESWSVAAGGSYAYVGDRTFGLRVVDVTVWSAPREVGAVDTTGYAGIEDMVVVDHIVYAAGGFDGLLVLDVTDPAAPVETDVYDTPGTVSAVAVADDLVYLADGLGGLYILGRR